MSGLFPGRPIKNLKGSGQNSTNLELLLLEPCSIVPPEDLPMFNEDLRLWNTASVTDMCGMFENALVFNQPIGAWDTSAVMDMRKMFKGSSCLQQAYRFVEYISCDHHGEHVL